MPENISIRKFEAKDREAVRNITYNTALMGEPASLFFDGEEIICDALTLYYTDYEPQSCFVAEADGEVVGCLIGARNKAASEKIISDKILPKLFCKAFRSGSFLKIKNIAFIFRAIISVIRGEFMAPDFSKEYPATLHINIKQGFRGLRIGSKLINAYLCYLKENQVTALHLATMSEAAGKFFADCGFSLLYTGKRSYFRHLLHKDVPLYIYGKRLVG